MFGKIHFPILDKDMRICLGTILVEACAAAVRKTSKDRSIELHVGLPGGQAREQKMLHNFHTIFRPPADKQRGFIDVKIMKLRSAPAGGGPSGANYRFKLTVAGEQQRQARMATTTHQQVWPTIETTLVSNSHSVLLYDEV